MNSISIIGRLVKSIEVKETEKGPVANFSVAVNGVKETTFFKCSAFGNQVNVLHDFVKKGQYVGLSGSMICRRWTTTDGEKRESWELNVNRVSLCGGNDSEEKPPARTKSKAKQAEPETEEQFEY